jgi:hypothetical protein
VRPPLDNTADALEELTHNLCHLFGRATEAVSLCPADLLCTRLRCYLPNEFDPNDSLATGSVSSSMTSSMTSGIRRQSIANVRISENLKDSMFYI